MSPIRSLAAAAAGALALAASIGPAQAGFDPETGRVSLEGAALGLSFDTPTEPAQIGPAGYFDGAFRGTTATEQDFERDQDLVIEGEAALRLSPRVTGVVFTLDRVAESLRGRRFEARLWYRPQGSYPVAEIIYAERGGAAVLSDQATFFAPLGKVRLLPTGRATDDGWIELSTGPVDYRLAGAIEARVVRILDVRLWEVSLFRSTSIEGSVLVDGLEFTDLGPAAFDPQRTCRRASEESDCGSGGACFIGRCADPKPVLGNVPDDPEVRGDYLERQITRLRGFAGGRIPQDNLGRFAQSLRGLRNETNLLRYWSIYRRAYDDLADGHLSEPVDDFGSLGGAGACIHVGEIDLLPGPTTTGHLVYTTATGHPIGERLNPGDALVSIDGLSVDAWVALSDRDLRYKGDPRARRFILAPDILNAAIRAGSILRFERCPRSDGTPCTAAQVETIDIDTAELLTDLRGGRRPSWLLGGLACDFRFLAPPGTGSGSSDRVRFSELFGLRTIVINGVSGFGQWRRDAQEATTNLPNQVVLDQRTGGGGTFDGVSLLAVPFFSANEQPSVQIFPWVVPALDASTRAQFVRCGQSGGLCGNYFPISVQGQTGNPRSRVPNARLAILNGRDVSGNDYLPRILKSRRNGQTRIFGAVPTYGAFGPIFTLPRILDELRGGSVQLQDTLFLSNPSDTNLQFATGRGVEPDEVIYQRQSDALLGRDTLLDAATTWVTGGNP